MQCVLGLYILMPVQANVSHVHNTVLYALVQHNAINALPLIIFILSMGLASSVINQ